MTCPLLSRTVLTALALGAVTYAAEAQQPVPVTRITQPIATFKQPFSQIRGFLELRDGRALVSDGLEETLSEIDFAKGTDRTIGRQGGGPGEYADPGPLYAIARDTTFMLDMGNLRGVLITPAGTVGSTISLRSGSGFPVFPHGVDTLGRIYAEPPLAVMNGTRVGPADSSLVIRWDPRRGGPLDTVAHLATTSSSVISVRISGGPGGMGAGAPGAAGPRPFAPSDGWAVAPDGRVAIVRASDYHVEWIAPDGRRTVGPAVPYVPVAITRADKNAWADRQTQGKIVMRTPEGTRTMHPSRPDPDKLDWPTVKPPFDARDVFVTPDGELWVRRMEPADDESQTYDVFDARGVRTKQMVLPAGRELVGFGRETVYAMHKDSDDLEWLEMYRR